MIIDDDSNVKILHISLVITVFGHLMFKTATGIKCTWKNNLFAR